LLTDPPLCSTLRVPLQQRVLAAVILAAVFYVLFLVVSETQGKRGLRRDGGGAVTSRG